MTVHQRQNIPITETWIRSSWSNFDADQQLTSSTGLGLQPDTNSGFPFSIAGQSHTTIRTFVGGETWTNNAPAIGSNILIGYLSGLNHWPGASLGLPGGTWTFTSTDIALNLTTLGSQAQLVLALPTFPLGKIDLTNTFVDLSSDGFNTKVCSLPWSASATPLINGNSTLAFPYSALTGCDLTSVTGVRFRIKVITSCTVTLMALRLIGPNWIQTNVDYDSLNGQLRQCIPLTGDPALVPVPANQALPPLWRSATTPGDSDDPRPINAEIGYIFNTGSQTHQNAITIYMRETTAVVVTQGQLQGKPQEQISGQPQSTFGLNETATDQWVKFALGWGPTSSAQITSANYPNTGYRYDNRFSLSAKTTYLVVCNVTDTTARMQIYNVDQTKLTIGTLVFDTTRINDSFTFVRRAGRVGFQANLQDGDAYLSAIRPRSLMFAEYRSAPLKSITPVRGARLYVPLSDLELFQSWSPLADVAHNQPLVTVDQQRFVAPGSQSTKVTVITPSTAPPAQGVISNVLTPPGDTSSGITDFGSFHLEFNLWISEAAITAPLGSLGTIVSSPPLSAALVNASGAVLPINLPVLTGNQWQAVSIFVPFPQPFPQSGPYQFVLYYLGGIATTFWIDGVSLHQHTIDWDGRSVVDDPWNSSYAPWTNFHDTVSSDTNGIVFTTQGTSLQIRGQARTADASILSPPKIVPQYTELGHLVWPEDGLGNQPGPTVTLTLTNIGRTYTFSGNSSSSPNQVGNWLWAFGDGSTGSGPVITHTYDATWPLGTALTVTLTVIDRLGLSATTSTVVTL